MDGQTDDPITRCRRRTFQAGGIKIKWLLKNKKKKYLCFLFKSKNINLINKEKLGHPKKFFLVLR